MAGQKNRYAKWNPAEDVIIDQAEKAGMRAKALFQSGRLPGRTILDIQNRFGTKRALLRGVCPKCRLEKGTQGRMCPECLEVAKAHRHHKIAQGLCALCAEPRGMRGSATLCRACLNKRQKHTTKNLRKRAAQNRPPGVDGLLSWPGTRSGRVIAASIPDKSKIVDLFSGTGRSLLWANQAGHHIHAYNDAHPPLAVLIRALVQGGERWKVLREHLKQLNTQVGLPYEIFDAWYQQALAGEQDPLYSAALFYLLAKNKFSGPLKEVRKIARANNVKKGLAGAEILCGDYTEALQALDSPSTLFLADPPWPGSSYYGYNFEGRHGELVKDLLKAKGEFVLVLQSTGECLQALKGVPYLYWSFVGLGKEILACSQPLKEAPSLRPFKLKDFGIV